MPLIAISALVFLALGVPIAIVLGASSLLFLFFRTDLPLVLIPQRMFVGTDVFILMCLPFFILAGLLMNEGGITQRLVRLSQFLVGNLRGSLAQVNVVTSMFFGGITGAAVADTSAVGTVLIPAMVDEGYDSEFAAAVTASSSIIGPIIPPSIPMLVYAFVSDTSVGALFLAGAIPGIVIGFSMIFLNYFLVTRGGRSRPLRVERRSRAFREMMAILKDGLLALIMPIIIVGGIVGGVFTPTEASAVAVFYAFFVGFFIFREIKLSRLPAIFLQTGILSAVVMFIIATSKVLAWILAFEQIPQQVTNLFLSISGNWVIFLILIIVLLLFVGTFLEPSGALIILVPVLLPTAKAMGFDPVHFGAIMVIGLVIGLITPPVGLCLFVASSISKVTIEKISRACIPFICLLVGVLLLVAFFPSISLWLPRVIMGYQG